MRSKSTILQIALATVAVLPGASAQTVPAGTLPLEATGDLAAEMVEGIHRYLDTATQAAAKNRNRFWQRDYSSHRSYERSVDPNRDRLRVLLGVVDERLPVDSLELVTTTARPSKIAEADGYDIHEVRWQVLPGIMGEGILLQPHAPPLARVVAIPDALWSPEMLAGIEAGVPANAQFARRLAENDCQVVVPTLIDRTPRWTGLPGVLRTNLPHREFLYRMSYELGRHLIGYEIQRILSVVDFFEARNREQEAPLGVMGYGEGGLLALDAAALDKRISSAVVSGYFQQREGLWRETIDRSVWALLREFGDAEIAGLIAPRRLVIESSPGPEVSGQPPTIDSVAERAASGRLAAPPIASVRTEFHRARQIYESLGEADQMVLVDGMDGPGTDQALMLMIDQSSLRAASADVKRLSAPPDSDKRMRRQFDQIVAFNHLLTRDSPKRRSEFWSRADASSIDSWKATTEFYREYLWNEVIGRLPDPDRPANPRTRRIYDHADFQGFEVVLDVWEDVFAHGVLLVPDGLAQGEKRPVVVAQHGLEGRPSDVVDPDTDHRAYHRYGARLAQEGFVVYAPQNPYIGRDRFRQIQRKAHPLKLSLYSFIVGQHQQTLSWLKSLPFVDPDRIGFYGLSYGGKTAVRIPPLLADYALSICSADFNEWVWKNTSTTDRYSYLFTREYDMLEFNFANVVNYAELATLMAPRPFMVERGHSDGVAPDEWVAYEFAKVRRFYNQIGLGDRAEIEFFDGPHEIHGEGTFQFLRKHLDWN